MCGIAGFVERFSTDQTGKADAFPRLDKMLGSIAHRGPDDWGMSFFSLPVNEGDPDRVHRRESSGASLALGHRRLSILDLNPRGRQPMVSSDGSLTITFNGEIYNYLELKTELAEDATFRTETDTEVLLEAYRRWGVGMLERLDGMFAFAIWDERRGKLVCARDPFGIKPFYFGQNGQRFVFASEPRGVLAGLGTSGHVDVPRVAEFLMLRLSDHDGGTSFQEVHQLLGGHWMEVDPSSGISEPHRFWTPPKVEIRNDEEVLSQVRAQIDLAVFRQLRADVPIGSCLSGGVDSCSIVSTVSRLMGSEAAHFKTFTISNDNFEKDESKQAREIADRVGVGWIGVEPDLDKLTDELEQLVRIQGEPFGGLSIYAQYKVMQKAHQHGLKVMLDGQGGDEVFIGYRRVASRLIWEYLRRGRVGSAIREWHGLSQNAALPMAVSALGNLYFNAPRLATWYEHRRLKPMIDRDWIRQIRPETIGRHFGHKDLGAHQLDELTYSPLPSLLRYEDRDSMAFGLEARVPLLSVGLVNLGLSLPSEWKVRGGWTKYVLRKAMQDRLPDEVVWSRGKLGFEVPQKRWVERARPQIAAWLSDLPRHSPINGPAILEHIDAGQGGADWVWRCLSVALWIRSEGVSI